MKAILSLLITIYFSIAAFSQLPDNAIAPDFTATDINGEEHNLYNLLDQGKTVILDIYSTRCQPCWTFHEEGTLKNIWEELGPDGTDEVFILTIESELFTDLEDLQGTGNLTFGDFVTGTPYPLIDEQEGSSGYGKIFYDYLTRYFPTFYVVCPDRRVTQVSASDLTNNYATLINECPSLAGELNVEVLVPAENELVYCPGSNFTPTAKFQNMGNQVITAATFLFSYNGYSEEVVWEGNLKPFNIDEVFFSTITSAANTTIELTSVNNQPDETPDNNTISTALLVPLITEMDTVTVEIMTDFMAKETYWAVLNEADEIISSGGNEKVGLDANLISSGSIHVPNSDLAYENATLYTTDVYLPKNGCYRFVITDYYLDGICCDDGDGYFKVISKDNEVLVEGTEFTGRSENSFVYQWPLNTLDQSLSDLNIFPNPTANELTISFDHHQPNIQAINIFDLQGRILFNSDNSKAMSSPINLDLSTLHSGLYVLQIRLEDGSFIQRKVIKK